jgi:hypothetical protein
MAEPSASEVEMAVGKLRRGWADSSRTDISRSETLHSEIHKLIKFIWNKKDLPRQWKKSCLTVHEKCDKTDCSNYRGISLLSTSYTILSIFFCLCQIYMRMKLLGNTSSDFDVLGQQLMGFSISLRCWRKSGNVIVQYISYFQILRKPIIQLGGKFYTVFSLNVKYPGN